MTCTIIDKFLSQNEFEPLERYMMGYYFPWFYMDRESYETETDTFQFQHTFYRGGEYPYNSEYFDLVKPILRKLEVDEKNLHRIKAILTTKTLTSRFSGYHIDFKDITTSVYYVNTNNGGTAFENGKFVKSEQNKLVTFPMNLKHRTIPHTDNNYERIVINKARVSKFGLTIGTVTLFFEKK